MSLIVKLRRGEGPVWGALKRSIKRSLCFHLPAAGPWRWLFALCYALHVGLREGLAWTLRFFWYEPLFRSQCVRVGDGFQMEQLPYINGRGRIVIGRRVQLSGKSGFTFGNRHRVDPVLDIGDDTFIGHGCSFTVARSVRIGTGCLLAGNVRIADYDGHPVDAARRRAKEPAPPESIRPVTIGDDVWIGYGSIILKGVSIGDRAIVGAGAVLTRDVPADVVVAGNPARIVKHLSDEEIRRAFTRSFEGVEANR